MKKQGMRFSFRGIALAGISLVCVILVLVFLLAPKHPAAVITVVDSLGKPISGVKVKCVATLLMSC